MEVKRVPTGKEYRIQSFEQLVNIATSENVGDIAVDFMIWLNLTVKIAEELRSGNEITKAQKKLTNWELLKPTFIWLDDGLNEISKCIISHPKTGEQFVVDSKKPNIKINTQ